MACDYYLLIMLIDDSSLFFFLHSLFALTSIVINKIFMFLTSNCWVVISYLILLSIDMYLQVYFSHSSSSLESHCIFSITFNLLFFVTFFLRFSFCKSLKKSKIWSKVARLESRFYQKKKRNDEKNIDRMMSFTYLMTAHIIYPCKQRVD